MKQVPLVRCSMCKARWPLGGVVDTVHPVSGENLPNHPQLQAVDRKVVCYECVFKHQLLGVPLTEALHESLSRRPYRPSPRDVIRTKLEAPTPRAVTIRVLRDVTPQAPRILSRDSAMKTSTPREIFRTVRQAEAPAVPVRATWYADPLPPAPINPALSKKIREEVKKAAIERADNARHIDVGGKPVPVVAGRMQGMFLRPSRWSLTEPAFQSVPMGTATPAYVPMRDDVLSEVFELAENADIEVRLAKEPTIHVQDRLLGLAPEHTQALRRQIKRFHKKKSG